MRTLLASAAVVLLIGCSGPVPSPMQSPTDEQPVAREETRANEELGYGVAYPASWFVHPPGPDGDPAGCAWFAAEPFEFDGGAPAWGGASVRIVPLVGACLNYEPEITIQGAPVEIGDGFPAWRIEEDHGRGVHGYSYVVNLRPQAGPVLEERRLGLPAGDCTKARGLLMHTRDSLPGDPEANRRVLDRMAATLSLDD